MALVKPFKGLRPPKELVELVECRPYDVLSAMEARIESGDNPMSLYHIIRPEIDFPHGVSEYAPEVYQRGAQNFAKFQRNGWLKQDAQPMYYLYAQTMNGHTQHGFVVGVSVTDYMNGIIKKHELTRHDKEEDRMKHIRATNANIEPVFLMFPDNDVLKSIITKYVALEPEYNFVAPIDGFGHKLWLIDDQSDIETITKAFADMSSLYIADGHHRTAAAALVGREKAIAEGNRNPQAEYNFLMAVCFPASELTVLDYNRVVKDIGNFNSTQEFLKALENDFIVECFGQTLCKPTCVHQFSLYIDGLWYRLTVREGRFNEQDPVDVLDVSISSRLILDKLLGIKDLRKDKRIDFVGGLRGLNELKQRCDSGEMRWALALYPVSVEQIMNLADKGKIMPPKATWFEPKLRSGLVIHKLA